MGHVNVTVVTALLFEKKLVIVLSSRVAISRPQMARKTTTTKKTVRQVLAVQKRIEKTTNVLKQLQERLSSLQSEPAPEAP